MSVCICPSPDCPMEEADRKRRAEVTMDSMPIENLVSKENDLKPLASRLLDELMEEACCCAITGQDCQGENCKNPCRVCDA